jgi:hypothetical protein
MRDSNQQAGRKLQHATISVCSIASVFEIGFSIGRQRPATVSSICWAPLPKTHVDRRGLRSGQSASLNAYCLAGLVERTSVLA